MLVIYNCSSSHRQNGSNHGSSSASQVNHLYSFYVRELFLRYGVNLQNIQITLSDRRSRLPNPGVAHQQSGSIQERVPVVHATPHAS